MVFSVVLITIIHYLHIRWRTQSSAFCVYIDNPLVLLSEIRVGCYIGNIFVFVAYADESAIVFHRLCHA